MNQMARALHELIADRQHNRILRLSFPRNDGPLAQFVVNQLDAEEAISRDFEFTIELLSSDPNVPLKEMQGKLLNVELVQQEGTLRHFSGYVFNFRRKKSDGSVTFYEAKLGPWLKYLSLRRNSCLFHGKTLREQTEHILGGYGAYANWNWCIGGCADAMTQACQFQESDFNYLSRRWEDAGILYWYEHSAAGHQLVLSDDSVRAQPLDGDSSIRFQRHGGSIEEDAIDLWSSVRQAAPTSAAVRGFDFKWPFPNEVGVPTLNKQGIIPELESFEYVGAYGFKNASDGDRISRLRMEEVEAAARYFTGEGNNRSMVPGRSFFLTEHFSGTRVGSSSRSPKDEFLILTVQHSVSNNYLQCDESPMYRNSFSCSRKMVPWRPGRGFNSIATKILAPQTATVVGRPGQASILTDEFGRIRIQFHWDRVGKNDESSSAWIRVASGWAGAQLGAAALPRVGAEVIVQWLEGNPDRPIVTGSVYNDNNMPPWKLESQQALTGLRSRELVPGGGNSAYGRSNHLILDDSYQRIQAQLKSDHEQSQLSLGYITRIENNAGRQHAGGEGWEIATNAWGVARAGRGMLLTTEAISSATPQAKDMGGALQRLISAQDQHSALAGMAESAKAQEPGQQSSIADALARQNNGIRGGAGDFPELSEPQIVLASPAGIALSSAGAMHLASASSTAITSTKALSIASSDLFASVANTFRLFVHKAGMKLIAASGKVAIQAQRDELEVLANKVLTLISETDWVDIKGKKGVRLHGADCMIEIGEKVQVFTSSPTLFHGSLQTLAPKSVSQHFNERPTSRFNQEVRFLGPDNKPAKDIEHEIHREDGSVIDGKTAASGTTGVQKSTGMDSYTIRYKGELP
jgi:type VI secretion system secreted protein VgrG